MLKKSELAKSLLSKTGKVSHFLGDVSGGFIFVMMLIIVYDVLMRRVFNKPTIWADETSCYLLVGVTFLGAAYTLKMGGHIHIEALVGRLKPNVKQRWMFVIDVLTFAFLVAFTWQTYKLAIDAYVNATIATTLLRTPVYIPQLLIPIGLTWLCLQLLAEIWQSRINLRVARGGNKDYQEDQAIKEM